tara:strand:+ start:17598 stop:18956 length:1359 start_codon:yes stop_codon:yes gene_type:complete
MLANTAIWLPQHSTDLADAFERFQASFRGQCIYAPGGVENSWLNALRDRALRHREQPLLDLTEQLLTLFTNPTGSANFKEKAETAYREALLYAYPVSCALINEFHLHSGTTSDYTLNCFDLGQVRAIEDDALTDASMKVFAKDMLSKLNAQTKSPRHEVYRSVFDVYSEALVCRLLRERSGGRLQIKKIAETTQAGPDFECELDVEHNSQKQVLSFFIEVKALDIVHAPQRLPEILDEGMDVQIELERQLIKGRRVAMAEGVFAPHRGYGNDPDYDHRSIRVAIENLTGKAAGNFKNTQFRRGPTFALANLLRLPLPGQGAGTMSPFYYDPAFGGACLSGALWHMAFGEVGAPIHRAPDFEGEGTVDGTLQRAGILVDQALGLKTPGLIAFHFDQGAYRFDGFYDARWGSDEWNWNDPQTEEVMHALCGDYNDRTNRRAHDYARYRDRSAKN